jgi:hypothetical protein
VTQVGFEFRILEEDGASSGALKLVHHRGQRLTFCQRNQQMDMVDSHLDFQEPNSCALCSLGQQPSGVIAQFALERFLARLRTEPNVVKAFHHLTLRKLRVSTLRFLEQ